MVVSIREVVNTLNPSTLKETFVKPLSNLWLETSQTWTWTLILLGEGQLLLVPTVPEYHQCIWICLPFHPMRGWKFKVISYPGTNRSKLVRESFSLSYASPKEGVQHANNEALALNNMYTP